MSNQSIEITLKDWNKLSKEHKKMLKEIGIVKPKKQHKKTDKLKKPTAPKDYTLRKHLSCACCKSETIEDFIMKYKEINGQHCLQAFATNRIDKPDATTVETITTCRKCRTVLSQWSRTKLIEEVMGLHRLVVYARGR